MPEPITEPKGPLYDLRLDHEIDTLMGHALDLQPGGYYRFQLPDGDWQGRLDNLRACLPKGVVLRPESPPHKGEQLYFYRRGIADDLNGITSAQTPRSLKSLLPGLHLPAWLRRFLRERKVLLEARRAAREARSLREQQAALRTTLAKEALTAMIQHGTAISKPHYRNPATGVIRHRDKYETTDADVERWKTEGFVYLPDRKVLAVIAVEFADNLIAELDRPPVS